MEGNKLPQPKDQYKQDGVDVVEGDKFSAYAGKICQSSFKNSPFVEVLDPSGGYFRGVRSFRFRGLPDGFSIGATSDGNGTKVVFNDAAQMPFVAARDLIAMSCGDITRDGGLPLIHNNVLDAGSIGEKGSPENQFFRTLIAGLGDIAKKMRIVIFRGETAELGPCIGSEIPGSKYRFNWSGTAIGVYDPDMTITGNLVSEGQDIIAFREYGGRANGYSSFRKAFAMQFGSEWFNNPDAQPYIEQAAYGSVLYDPFLTKINGWYDGFTPLIRVRKLIHVTGGAFEGKLGQDLLFRKGLSAVLDNLWDPPEIMRLCQKWRDMPDEQAYKTWNGGQGMLAILDPDNSERFIQQASEAGLEAKICGKITKEDKPQIRIISKFRDYGREIIYNAT